MKKKTPANKKVTLNELGSMMEHVVKSIGNIEDKMATKDDVRKLDDRLTGVEDGLTAVESKVDGINRRLDSEAMMRTDQKLPERVTDLEVEIFGGSKAPKLGDARP
jgi:hypothetical protein